MAETVKKKRIYLAGPMRGYRHYNAEAFDSMRDWLVNAGHVVISPADMDRAVGLDPKALPDTHDWNSIPKGFDMYGCVDRCIAAVRSCDAVYMLPGWQNSKGATAERALALWLGREVIEAPAGGLGSTRTSVLAEAEHLISSVRNAQYGPPEQDFRRTADMWTALLQYRMKEGERIRMQDVAWMMMCLKASRAQHQDKRDNYVDAAGYAGCGWRCVESQKGDADGRA